MRLLNTLFSNMNLSQLYMHISYILHLEVDFTSAVLLDLTDDTTNALPGAKCVFSNASSTYGTRTVTGVKEVET